MGTTGLPSSLTRCWDDLVKGGQGLTFHKGQYLFYHGHTPYGVFVLQSGQLKFIGGRTPCEVAHGQTPQEGEVIGLHHFLKEVPYCCDCIAATDCRLVFISKSQLLPFANT